MEHLPLVLEIAAALIALRVAADRLDRGRIARHLARLDGRLLGCRWKPFEGGSLIERRYDVSFEDATGHRHAVAIDTSLLTGVFVVEDTVVAGPGQEARSSSSSHRA